MKQDLRRTAPDFRPFERPQDFRRPPEPAYLKIEDDMSAHLDSWFAIPEFAIPEDEGLDTTDAVSILESEAMGSVRHSPGPREQPEVVSAAAETTVVMESNIIGLYDVRRIIKE